MKLNSALPVCKYNTPSSIVDVIAKHTPKNISQLLDPAVGEGSLLYPFINQNLKKLKRVVCIDIEGTALNQVYRRYYSKLGDSLELYQRDFIQWSSKVKNQKSQFDCIVMNPPFCGRNDVLIKINMQAEFSTLKENYRYVPIEIAFIIRTIRLLKPYGKLFAVLPSSLITSERMGWVRKFMLKMGAVLCVHEFPRYSFKGVEGRTYLLIFNKFANQKKIIVSNWDSNSNTRMTIEKSDIINTNRFDYEYHSAYRQYDEAIRCSPSLKWEKVINLLDIYRGSIDSPLSGKTAIHTSNYKCNRWECETGWSHHANDATINSIQKGDLLVKRVGRNCSQSIGIAPRIYGLACTDCIFILRPRDYKVSIPILLALRIIANSKFGAKLIERGVGAKYISTKSLLRLIIPYGAFKTNPQRFETYFKAVKSNDYNSMLRVEQNIRLDHNIPL
jgi:tRNA1(Val) A37 N6-methylase TrmN6